MSAEHEARFSEKELRSYIVKFEGGSGTVSEEFGSGVSVAYVSTGIVEVSWPSFPIIPGTWIGPAGAPAFEAVTPADVKAFVGVVGVYNSTTHKVRIYLYESGSLADLAANEWCTVTLLFHQAPRITGAAS